MCYYYEKRVMQQLYYTNRRNCSLDTYQPNDIHFRSLNHKPKPMVPSKQLRSKPGFVHSDFATFSRLWCTKLSLCLTSGLRKNYATEVGVRSFHEYQIISNLLFQGQIRRGQTRKNFP